MAGCAVFMLFLAVLAVRVPENGTVVIRSFFADLCGSNLCPHETPTCAVEEGEKEKESRFKCVLLDRGNVTMWHVVQDSFEIHQDCIVDVMKVTHAATGFWTAGSKYGLKITWSLETEGKLFRVVCGGLVVYVKFHGVDQDSLWRGTTSPRPHTTYGQSSTSVATTPGGATTTYGRSSTSSTTLGGSTRQPDGTTVEHSSASLVTTQPYREENGFSWYAGVGIFVGVVLVLSLVVIFVHKRKRRGIVYGGIELGAINAASEEETPL